MIKEARGIGATIDEAKENAVASLGAGPDDDIQFEVISTPKKKTLGLFGGSKAEVRVYIEVPDEKPAKAPKNEGRPAAKAPAADKPKAPEKKADAPAAKAPEKPRAAAPQKAAAPAEKAAAPEKAAEKPQSVEDDYKNAVDISEIPATSPAVSAVAYLRTILAQLGCGEITVKVAEKENGAFILLDGEGLGVIIGHRGETLDALQYLAGLAANNGGGYYKVSLNIGNYREKREQTLIGLAGRVSAQVLRTGRSRSLEPMNPYERRIIHTAVQEIEGVVSNSIGEGSGRRVVISPEGGDTQPPRRDDSHMGGHRDHGGHRGGNGRGPRDRGDRRPSNTVATAPSREPKKDSDIPLYGKIN